MRWRLVDQGHGEGAARLLETDGNRALVESSQPFPTGATLIGVDLETGVEYRVKVRHGRREDELRFRIEGRFLSLTKEQREAVLAAVAPQS
jgi:hypothetical protein